MKIHVQFSNIRKSKLIHKSDLQSNLLTTWIIDDSYLSLQFCIKLLCLYLLDRYFLQICIKSLFFTNYLTVIYKKFLFLQLSFSVFLSSGKKAVLMKLCLNFSAVPFVTLYYGNREQVRICHGKKNFELNWIYFILSS